MGSEITLVLKFLDERMNHLDINSIKEGGGVWKHSRTSERDN